MQITTYRLLSLDIFLFIIAGVLYYLGMPEPAKWLVFITVVASTLPFLINMIKDLYHGHYGVDILAITAVVASLALGQYIAAGIIVLMLTGGQALEFYAQHKARTELNDLLAHVPQIAHVLIDGKLDSAVEDRPVEQVQIGDILLIKPGQTAPVDGTIVEGNSSFDESAITGESLPVDKTVGIDVLSGSINNDASVKIKTTHTSGDSQYQQIIKLVESAASSQSPLVRLADTYSIPFSLISFGIAGVAWWLSGSALRGLEVLVVATPCPLLIATPVAIVAGINRSAKQGIIIKTGGAIEQLARVKAIAFDKTGTLTLGNPTVSDIIPRTLSIPFLLGLAAGLSKHSNHVLSHAIVTEAESRNTEIPTINNVTESTGNGVTAEYDGKTILLGKQPWLEQNHIQDIPQNDTRTETSTYVAIDGIYEGVIYFSDPIRPESMNVLQTLKKMGIQHTKMLTGDHAVVATAVAKELGDIEFTANCKPADKVNEIKLMQQTSSPVAMVGDGVNDAPTLVSADVGIAIGARGSTAASESADIVIMPNDINRVVTSINIARRTIHIAKQSIFVGIGLSIVLMLIATSGLIKPMYGALLQEGVDVLVILNALRALKGAKSHS